MIRAWTKWMEKRISNSNFFIDMYELYYKNVVKNEIRLARVEDKDNILCIGGGAVPCTALQMAMETGAKVHVIDIDPIAVYNAKNLINKKGLSHRIQVSNKNGQEIDIRDYDVIHVALQVSPKEKVLENLWKKARKGTKIVVRMPKKGLNYFYSSLSCGFLETNDINCERCSAKKGINTMDRTLLMVKN
ncbi:nicotianamine synthase family protein [Clostridiisalibacter paucivorans]|uniref:nicotianamine synthase family protein n=1 Tax=Clostridiisalibacter paucivorans TaxID=408753 RepID=UPI000478A6B6|nr:nicotianamine synthase family protein [Clostridiisalibacter paucivorans]